MSFQIQGCAGVKGAAVTLSGAAAAIVISDLNGNFLFPNLAAGSYVITPVLASYSFTPASRSVVVTNSNVNGINFKAATSSAATVVIDSRTDPNTTVDVQATQFYTVPQTDSRLDGQPVDSRASVPADSRVSVPSNSRNEVGE